MAYERQGWKELAMDEQGVVVNEDYLRVIAYSTHLLTSTDVVREGPLVES